MKCSSQPERRRGFTLMEVLVVLAILVMLFGMAVPKIMERFKSARVSTAKTQIGLFKQALEHYYMDVKEYPSAEQGLQALVERPAELPESATWSKYLDEVPKDPWGHDFRYDKAEGDEAPRLWSVGPDGNDDDGENDDITSWVKAGEGESKESAGSSSGSTKSSSSKGSGVSSSK